MKTIIIASVLCISFLLKMHLYVFTIIEVIANLDINSVQDVFEVFNFKANKGRFVIGILVNLVIIYYTLKLKTLIIKKILTAPIVVKIARQLREIALFLYSRYYSKAV